jgi:hypothetical protein
MLQALFVQATAATPALAGQSTEQLLPQLPQFAAFDVVLISQPSAGFLLQSAKPALQLSTSQLAAAHPAVPFWTKHWCPQPPQLFGSPLTLTSHPLIGLLSQLENPWLHVATVHAPDVQLDVALASWQTLPH